MSIAECPPAPSGRRVFTGPVNAPLDEFFRLCVREHGWLWEQLPDGWCVYPPDWEPQQGSWFVQGLQWDVFFLATQHEREISG